MIRFDIKRRWDIGTSSSDPPIMEVCLTDKNVLVTFDLGTPPQAYYHDFGQNGLTIVLLRWKSATYRDWQQIVEVILRDSARWLRIAVESPSVISVGYKSGSRARPWGEIPPMIATQVKN